MYTVKFNQYIKSQKYLNEGYVHQTLEYVFETSDSAEKFKSQLIEAHNKKRSPFIFTNIEILDSNEKL